MTKYILNKTGEEIDIVDAQALRSSEYTRITNDQVIDDYTKKSILAEDYEMLSQENKNMANALKKLGYTDNQISDICNGAI